MMIIFCILDIDYCTMVRKICACNDFNDQCYPSCKFFSRKYTNNCLDFFFYRIHCCSVCELPDKKAVHVRFHDDEVCDARTRCVVIHDQ